MISTKEAVKIIDKWSIDWEPQYRGFICGGCGKTVRKAWHIHVKKFPYKRELHLCRKCGKKYDLK